MPDTPEIHPIASILAGVPNPRYGPEASHLIVRISELCSESDLYAWWEEEIGSEVTPELARKKSIAKYNQLINPTGEGWQLGDIYIGL